MSRQPSRAPQGSSQSSKNPTMSYAPGRNPSTIYEEEETTSNNGATSSCAPTSSRAPTSSLAPTSSRAPTQYAAPRAPTQYTSSRAPTQNTASRAPTQYTAPRAPTQYAQPHQSVAPAQSSRAAASQYSRQPSQMGNPATTSYSQSTSQGAKYTTLNRDDARQSKAGPPPAKSQAYRSTMARPAASTRAKSILATPEDFKMAQTQLHRDELEGVEAEEQDEWARKMIATIPNACPDKMAFERHDTLPLYMCAKGGHAVTDELLAEGLGGLMAAPKGRAPPGGFPFEEFEGPFYLDEESEFYVTDCKKWWARKNKERENK
ncbi:hypothetical protein GLAREA_11097 [Glarea lozoyensis ATCC 20868]|uniref:Uncharacterized protein n=1 Tax=Glarea lozoyensis (strain ATCC 20868 / MF5171) TaxID=1116229 RepID=S3EAQ2_GLAL2|nr:uncharacterized protein GLAREA_11097 [Glarea lozoyensis ATCC 20868]EPE35398.1 hypothetical protein GLAREA_11097 [Glarea lozoyensis ATCC 20868]